MRAAWLGPIIVASLAAPGFAQPAMTPSQPIPRLTADEEGLLARGEIENDTRNGAAVASVVLGFGAGQAFEHRYGDTGFLFTLGDLAFSGAFIVGLMQATLPETPQACRAPSAPGCGPQWNTTITIGLVGLLLSRTAQVADVFVGASRHNARVRALRTRVGRRVGVSPFVASARGGDGGVAGVALRF